MTFSEVELGLSKIVHIYYGTDLSQFIYSLFIHNVTHVPVFAMILYGQIVSRSCCGSHQDMKGDKGGVAKLLISTRWFQSLNFIVFYRLLQIKLIKLKMQADIIFLAKTFIN